MEITDMVSPNSELTPALVGEILHSDDPFPVLFCKAFKWLGYTRKDHAKTALTGNFVADLDYTVEVAPAVGRGRPSEVIRLTVDCFKALGMMAGTEKGREVRRYFLECERQLKELKQAQPESTCVLAPDPKEGFCALRKAPDKNATLHELTRRYSFGKGPEGQRRCRDWIRTQGIGDDEWVQYSSPGDRRLPRKHLAALDTARAQEMASQHPALATVGIGGTEIKDFGEVNDLCMVAAASQLLKDCDRAPLDEALLSASVTLWGDIAERAARYLGLELHEA
jgi:phage anti-repressor protein